MTKIPTFLFNALASIIRDEGGDIRVVLSDTRLKVARSYLSQLKSRGLAYTNFTGHITEVWATPKGRELVAYVQSLPDPKGWNAKELIPEKTRFFAKVKKSDGCWEWQAKLASNGYGQFQRAPGLSAQAHRIAWEYENGPIPEGLVACHKCDNRKCVRPSHIFLGTQSDNMKDCVAKGRQSKEAITRAWKASIAVGRNPAKGERVATSKLTEEQAMMVKSCPYKLGIVKFMANCLNVTRAVIVGIRGGVRWKHLPTPTEADVQKSRLYFQECFK